MCVDLECMRTLEHACENLSECVCVRVYVNVYNRVQVGMCIQVGECMQVGGCVQVSKCGQVSVCAHE